MQTIHLLIFNKESIPLDNIYSLLEKSETKKISITRCSDKKDISSLIKTRPIDVIVAALGFKESAQWDEFKSLCSNTPGIPVIALVPQGNKKLGEEALRQGAQDIWEDKIQDPLLLTGSLVFSIKRKKFQSSKDFDRAELIHEFKNMLSNIHESTSQVHEGLYGECTEDQKRLLKISLKNTDWLNRLLEDVPGLLFTPRS